MRAARLEVHVELNRPEIRLKQLGIQPAGYVASVGHRCAHANELEAVWAAKLPRRGLPLDIGKLGEQQLQHIAAVIVSNLPSQNMHVNALIPPHPFLQDQSGCSHSF